MKPLTEKILNTARCLNYDINQNYKGKSNWLYAWRIANNPNEYEIRK